MMHLTDRIGEASTIGVRARDVHLTDRIDFTMQAAEESARVRKRVVRCSPPSDS
ncbi:hypothetical protein [Burkholderia sp. BCC1972]|uniref:hypothetical protein n=1 Tax=Burkholderia sp. BCC1972 TaxID=2817438 RepID=UPI002ABE115E|nr:hypothetical protein [Burkholderia sp. BCC1972]